MTAGIIAGHLPRLRFFTFQLGWLFCQTLPTRGICFYFAGMKNRPVVLIFAAQPTNVQTESHWAQIVNWDGFSPWQKYINFAPAFMGLNAIPVPSLANQEELTV